MFKISFTSNPGAVELWLDYNYIGSSPVTVDLPAGAHHIGFNLYGYHGDVPLETDFTPQGDMTILGDLILGAITYPAAQTRTDPVIPSPSIISTASNQVNFGMGKLALINYQWHTEDTDAQLLASLPKDSILIDDTEGGYWHSNCDSKKFQKAGIKVFSYITSAYDAQTGNEALIDAIAAEGTYGVFIDECKTTATAALTALCNYAHSKGLKVIINITSTIFGTPDIDPKVYSIADYVLTDEHYTGRMPNAVEAAYLSQTIVVGYKADWGFSEAVAYTKMAWDNGFAAAYHTDNEYKTLPMWFPTYITLLAMQPIVAVIQPPVQVATPIQPIIQPVVYQPIMSPPIIIPVLPQTPSPVQSVTTAAPVQPVKAQTSGIGIVAGITILLIIIGTSQKWITTADKIGAFAILILFGMLIALLLVLEFYDLIKYLWRAIKWQKLRKVIPFVKMGK